MSTKGIGLFDLPDISRSLTVDLVPYRGRRVQIRYHAFGLSVSRRPLLRMDISVETLMHERSEMLR